MSDTRKRLTREQRLEQLLEVARQVIAEEGSDALSLGRLAEAAGITKPTVYDHFGTREGLLTALYRDFEKRQNLLIDAAMAAGEATLEGKARAIADSYVDCVLAEGREIPGVLAALEGSPELARLKRECQQDFLGKCRTVLGPFAGALSSAGLWGMLGAADALSGAAVAGEIGHEQARGELFEVIVSLVNRS
ncbi:TetR/AcrR family transcriptional regulator [Pseudomonas sp. GD04058]|uniref:TetR/AcrR family transcriptional regulator n=1 Tax=Pseudomonas sp. GD04058 TaxID=2975429 RepID=UPI00244AB3C3|nr:TetR/AcrR family transcriptional regulator [Pseudomonas sp. GD04058]MDG9883900.1 TetR/AcrR family transcriptional regulator [Pseudomonas sp. GD04058]